MTSLRKFQGLPWCFNTTGTFFLNTDVDVSILTKKTSDDPQLPLMTQSKGLIGAGGAPLQIVKEVNVCQESRGMSTSALVSVVQEAQRNLLDRDQIWELYLSAIVNAISSETFDPLKQFPKLFTELSRMYTTSSSFVCP